MLSYPKLSFIFTIIKFEYLFAILSDVRKKRHNCTYLTALEKDSVQINVFAVDEPQDVLN